MVSKPPRIMSKEVRAYLRQIGARGGAAKGAAKRRGNATYYRDLSRKRWTPDTQ